MKFDQQVKDVIMSKAKYWIINDNYSIYLYSIFKSQKSLSKFIIKLNCLHIMRKIDYN